MFSFLYRVYWCIISYYLVARHRLAIKGRLRVVGFPIIKNNGNIIIGLGLDLRSTPASTAMGVLSPVVLNAMRSDSVIRIGDSVGMSGVVVCCQESITIGNHVKFGSGALVCDTDFHALDYKTRASAEDANSAKAAPVVIGDDCFIGGRAMILKGVRVGDRSIVGAGAVVTKDVPPDSLVAGNPARVIRSLV